MDGTIVPLGKTIVGVEAQYPYLGIVLVEEGETVVCRAVIHDNEFGDPSGMFDPGG